MANAIEQALLLPADMANLRWMRNHEVLLTLKKDLALVSISTKRASFHFLVFFFFLSHNYVIIPSLLHLRPFSLVGRPSYL